MQLHSFSNGTSTATRKDNWEQIQKICSLKQVSLPAPLVQGTIQVKQWLKPNERRHMPALHATAMLKADAGCIQGSPGAAVTLLEHLYEKLTKKRYTGHVVCVLLVNTSLCCLLRKYFLGMQCAEAATPSAGCIRQCNTTAQSRRGIQQHHSRCAILRLSMQTHRLDIVL